ncbi:hypothetical protein [Burkholderia cepacia]|uniref:hypothetical protein n=1 Tax=Burkholderia cepacia TaxID=292 RepID=UPI002FE1DECE
MNTTLTYPIAVNRDTCDADTFCMRAHRWLQWERLDISPIAATIVATAVADVGDDLADVQLRDALRDELCDLIDALSALGLQLPLTLVVRCNENAYAAWHKLAGDQNWIRGTFCLEPIDEKHAALSGIAGADQFVSMLTDAEASYANTYRLTNVSDERFTEMIQERISGERNASVRVLAGYILDAISDTGVMRAGDPVGQNRVGAAVTRWMQQEVSAKIRLPDEQSAGTWESRK